MAKSKKLLPPIHPGETRGCMRTYLILKEKASKWNSDPEIQAILQELSFGPTPVPIRGVYSSESAKSLLASHFDRAALAAKRLPDERLDQLTTEVLLGVR